MNSTNEVLAKLARPRSRHIFDRTGLFDKLDAILDSSAIWINGPPGSGKTTLVSSYLQKKDSASLWYQLDEGDRDPASFFWYMRLAAMQLSKKAESRLSAYTSAYRGGLKAFAARFFESLYASLPPNFVIVLDDYHVVNAHNLDVIVAQAISSLPAYGNIIVISREAMPNEFCRLLGNQQLSLLDYEDLRLSPEEIKGVAAKRSIELNDRALDLLVSQLDGWAAGLIFELQSAGHLEMGEFCNGNGYHEAMFGYFASEVLAEQDPGAYATLTKLSLLPLMTQDLARQLTGDEQAGPLLNWLHRNNYFVDLQPLQVPTYRFHNLFRSFLRDRLEHTHSEEELRLLQLKAASLLETAGYSKSAAQLYEAAEAWDKVADYICANAAGKYRAGRMETLHEEIVRVPVHARSEFPYLEYWLGMSRVILTPELYAE